MLLAFREVKGNHSGDNLAKIVMEIVNEVGLTSKVRISLYEKPIQTDFTVTRWVGSPQTTSPLMTR
jgi:hypothetical protein